MTHVRRDGSAPTMIGNDFHGTASWATAAALRM